MSPRRPAVAMAASAVAMAASAVATVTVAMAASAVATVTAAMAASAVATVTAATPVGEMAVGAPQDLVIGPGVGVAPVGAPRASGATPASWVVTNTVGVGATARVGVTDLEVLSPDARHSPVGLASLDTRRSLVGLASPDTRRSLRRLARGASPSEWGDRLAPFLDQRGQPPPMKVHADLSSVRSA
jgi:hypothetical protein